MDREDSSTMSQHISNPFQHFRAECDSEDCYSMAELREEFPLCQNSFHVNLIPQMTQTTASQDFRQTLIHEMSSAPQPLNPYQPFMNQQPDLRYFGERAELGEALNLEQNNINSCPAPRSMVTAQGHVPEKNGQNPMDLLVLRMAAMFLSGAASFVDPGRAVETKFGSADDSKAEPRGFYGEVGGLDGKPNRKNKSRRKKKKALAEQQNALCIVDQETKQSISDTPEGNPIIEKWDELFSDNWKELMPCCARCQVELTSGQGLRCPRCHVALYCGNHCRNKDAKRHKPTCLRIFAFNAADAKWKEEAGNFKRLAESLAPELPEFVSGLRPASFYIGSVPNPDRFEFIGMPVPVLLEITSAGLAVDYKSWKLTGQDVASMPAYISIDTNETSEPFQRPENQYIAENLRVGNFILIKNAFGVCAGKDIFHIILKKPFLQFFFINGVNLTGNAKSFVAE